MGLPSFPEIPNELCWHAKFCFVLVWVLGCDRLSLDGMSLYAIYGLQSVTRAFIMCKIWSQGKHSLSICSARLLKQVLSQMLSYMMISCPHALIVMFSLVFEVHLGFLACVSQTIPISEWQRKQWRGQTKISLSENKILFVTLSNGGCLKWLKSDLQSCNSTPLCPSKRITSVNSDKRYVLIASRRGQ